MRRNRQKPDPEDADDSARIRTVALELLARREHSKTELRDKLTTRGWDAGVIDEVLDELAADGLQSDARYVEGYIRSCIDRGHGPVRIAHALMQRGIPGAEAEAALDAAGPDWDALAARARARRFGVGIPGDWPGKAKQLRFLQQRGFTAAQSRAAMDEESGSA